jgi:hypothetical protein
MAEAFGPYTSHDLHPMPDKRGPWPLSDLALAAIAVLVLALIAAGSI